MRTPMKYSAWIACHDPDDHESAEFETWDEAAEWLASQQRYFRGDLASMSINGDPVRFQGNVLVNMAPGRQAPQASPVEDVLSGFGSSQADFNRIFRPQTAR